MQMRMFRAMILSVLMVAGLIGGLAPVPALAQDTSTTTTVTTSQTVTSTTTASSSQDQTFTNESPTFGDQSQTFAPVNTQDMTQSNSVAPAGSNSTGGDADATGATGGTSHGGDTTNVVEDVQQANAGQQSSTQTAIFAAQNQTSDQTIAGVQVAEVEVESNVDAESDVETADSGNVVGSGNVVSIDADITVVEPVDPRTVTISFLEPGANGTCRYVVEVEGFEPGEYDVTLTWNGTDTEVIEDVLITEDGPILPPVGLNTGETLTATVDGVSSATVLSECGAEPVDDRTVDITFSGPGTVCMYDVVPVGFEPGTYDVTIQINTPGQLSGPISTIEDQPIGEDGVIFTGSARAGTELIVTVDGVSSGPVPVSCGGV